jgi:hypothetical protein
LYVCKSFLSWSARLQLQTVSSPLFAASSKQQHRYHLNLPLHIHIMSRNIRQKYPHTPVKAAKRRGSDTTTSSLDLSDDDDDHGYSGVEDVSDSDEDDEEHVFAAEEEHIISASRRRSHETPRPLESEDDADEEADEDDDDEVDDDDDVIDDDVSWAGIPTDHESSASEQLSQYLLEQDMASVERHVRFTGVPDSDSDSTTSETSEDHQEFFPDIFVDQNTLDPAFRREIENDDDSSHSRTFWGFQSSQDLVPVSDDELIDDSDCTPIATPMPSGMATVASTPTPPAEVQELDGYETDGDTTEEDVPEPPTRRKQMRRVSRVEPSSDSDTEKPTPFRRGKPRVGRFNLDKSERKPIAVVNPTTRKMMIFTPQRLSRLDLSPESFNIDFSGQDLSNCSPIVNNPGFVMMGAMLSSNTFGDVMNTQPWRPIEAFFPLTSDPPMGLDSSDSEFQVPDQDDEESMLKLEDFITFKGHDSSDEEEEESGIECGDIASSPTRPRTAASGASGVTDSSMAEPHPLLTHFNNSNIVGAFRQNQITQQLIYSEKASSEALAFGGPNAVLRGIKTGSLAAVGTPMTPPPRPRVRRANTMQGFDFTGSPQQKRKAPPSFTDSLHKKQRSISELDVLRI